MRMTPQNWARSAQKVTT